MIVTLFIQGRLLSGWACFLANKGDQPWLSARITTFGCWTRHLTRWQWMLVSSLGLALGNSQTLWIAPGATIIWLWILFIWLWVSVSQYRLARWRNHAWWLTFCCQERFGYHRLQQGTACALCLLAQVGVWARAGWFRAWVPCLRWEMSSSCSLFSFQFFSLCLRQSFRFFWSHWLSPQFHSINLRMVSKPPSPWVTGRRSIKPGWFYHVFVDIHDKFQKTIFNLLYNNTTIYIYNTYKISRLSLLYSIFYHRFQKGLPSEGGMSPACHPGRLASTSQQLWIRTRTRITWRELFWVLCMLENTTKFPGETGR